MITPKSKHYKGTPSAHPNSTLPKCAWSGKETNRFYKGLPIHRDVLERARKIRDKESIAGKAFDPTNTVRKLTLREVLMNKFYVNKIVGGMEIRKKLDIYG